MTDQSQPDRQNGDGLKAACELPLRQQIAYETFRGGFRDSACPAPPWDDAPPWVRDIATICYLQGTLDRARAQQQNVVGVLPCPFCGSRASASMYSPDMLFKVECTGCTAKVSGFDQCQQDAIDAWNTRATQPARDAAEGAGDPRLQAMLDAGLTFVPAQHEFSRENVIRLVLAARTVAFGDDHGGEDGMREIDAASEQFAESVPWEDMPGHEEMFGRALSPSGTGAAEPVAWQHRNIRKDGTKSDWMDCSDDHAKTLREEFPDFSETRPLYTGPVAWRAFCSKTGGQMINPSATKDLLIERADHLYAEHGYILQPLYAAPPVRGDREAIARALAVTMHGDDVEWRGFLTKADAFSATLPVQPGAGERS